MKELGVIITNRDTLPYLKLAVRSLRENNSDVDFDLYIADDGSTDGSKEWLRENRLKYNFSYTTHDEPKRRGIVRIVSEAVEQANNKVIFSGHSDMYYGKMCLKNLLRRAQKGKILCSTRIEPPIYPHEDCRIQMPFGVTTEEFDEKAFNEYVDKLIKANDGIITSGMFAPTMFMKEDWIGYDMDFSPQSREDSDLFNRWLQSGKEFVQPWDSLVYHFSGKGSRKKDGKDDSNEWKGTETKNLRTFIRKWGTTPLNDNYLHPIVAPNIPISAVILLHNEEDLVYNLLENVEPFFNDIVIVNDNSTDNSVSMVNKYASTLDAKYRNKITIVNNDNKIKDFSALRNMGVNACKGEYIFHIDCDESVEIGLLNNLRFLASDAIRDAIDVYGFSRLNTIDGQNTGVWPDYQFRFHRKGIKWVNKVHEVPSPVANAKPGVENSNIRIASFTIGHHKSSERQSRQNKLYRDMVGRKIDSVIIDSVIYTNEGITKHIRETARELKKRNMHVQLLDFYRGDGFGNDIKDLYEPVNVEGDNYFTIVNQPPVRWPRTLFLKNFVGYFAFEGNLPEEYVQIMNHPNVKEIWTPSTYCRECFIKSGVNKPIKVIHHGLDTSIWKPGKAIDGIKDNKDQIVFFGAGTWHNDRKGLDLLVRAFNEEFSPDENVKLLLKVNNIYNQGFDVNMKVMSITKRNHNIELLEDEYLPEEELCGIFNTVDCYVSPHRSEGFGLFILQAMGAGCKVIATGATGNTDFCIDKANNKLISLLPVANEKYIPLRDEVYKNATWVEPSLEELRKEMRKIFNHKYEYDTKKASDYVRENFTWDKVVDKMVMEVGKF